MSGCIVQFRREVCGFHQTVDEPQNQEIDIMFWQASSLLKALIEIVGGRGLTLEVPSAPFCTLSRRSLSRCPRHASQSVLTWRIEICVACVASDECA